MCLCEDTHFVFSRSTRKEVFTKWCHICDDGKHWMWSVLFRYKWKFQIIWYRKIIICSDFSRVDSKSESHTRTRRAKEAVANNDMRSLFFYQFCGSTRRVQMCILPKETGHTVISSGTPVSTPSIIMFNYKNVTPSAASKTVQNGKTECHIALAWYCPVCSNSLEHLWGLQLEPNEIRRDWSQIWRTCKSAVSFRNLLLFIYCIIKLGYCLLHYHRMPKPKNKVWYSRYKIVRQLCFLRPG